MAKSKKQITDFQEALLNNSKYIGKKPSEKKAPVAKSQGVEVALDPDIVFLYKQLSEKHQVECVALMELALKHFLNLEVVWFEENENKETKE